MCSIGKVNSLIETDKGIHPFFIIGIQRSGTTLLRLIINTHSMIAIPEEGVFWMPLIRSRHKDYNAPINKKSLRNYIKYLRKNEGFKVWKVNLDAALARLDFGKDITLRDLMLSLYIENAKVNNKRFWGDKTPSFFRKVNELSHIFPDAKFIHIIRDGRDTFLSMRGREPGRENVAVAAFEWKFKIQKVRESFKQLPQERRFEVRYEDILRSPEKKIVEICNFLGVRFEASMLDYYKSSNEFVGKHHSELIYKPISSNAAERWKKQMSNSENRIFEFIAKGALKDFGYDIITKESFSFLERLRIVALVCIGLPRRCFQIFYTAFTLHIASVLGLGTFASGGKGYSVEKK